MLFATRWAVHALVVLAVVAALFWLNHVLDLDRVLRSPWPALHQVWLPLLFLLAYALCWLGWWLLEAARQAETRGRRLPRHRPRLGRVRRGRRRL